MNYHTCLSAIAMLITLVGCLQAKETVTHVSISSGELCAIDPAYAGAFYKIPEFREGLYEVDYSAVIKGDAFDADSVLFLIDKKHAQDFSSWYHKVSAEVSHNVIILIQKLSEFEKTHDCRVGYFISEGIGTEFDGDGRYDLNIRKVRKLQLNR